jgi:hypothetical protein
MAIQLDITIGTDILFPQELLDQLPDNDPADYMLNIGPNNHLMINFNFFQNYMSWMLNHQSITYEQKTEYIIQISAFVDSMTYTTVSGKGVLEFTDADEFIANQILEFFKDYPTCSCVKIV